MQRFSAQLLPTQSYPVFFLPPDAFILLKLAAAVFWVTLSTSELKLWQEKCKWYHLTVLKLQMTSIYNGQITDDVN